MPVVVTDRSGHHIKGLKETDFGIEENGHVRSLASFEEVLPSSEPYHLTPSADFHYTNTVQGDLHPRVITIIVLDLLNTPFLNQTYARRQLIKFLSDHIENTGPTALCVLNTSGLHQVHSFTGDTSVLLEALKRAESAISTADGKNARFGDGSALSPLRNVTVPGDYASQGDMLVRALEQRFDNQFNAFTDKRIVLNTLQALEQLAHAYAGIPGRKSVVWATAGLPFVLNDPEGLSGMDITLRADYDRVWQALNSANIAIYPIDANGLAGTGGKNPSAEPQVGFQNNPMYGTRENPVNDVLNARFSLQAFAHATGGEACYNANDLMSCLLHATEDSSQYYILSYYLNASDRTPGWHKLKVQVHVPHSEIRARDGFFIGKAEVPAQNDLMREFDVAASSPIDYTSIPISLRINGMMPTSNGEHRVSFSIHFEPNGLTVDEASNNHVFFEAGAVAEDDQGRLARVFGRTVNVNLKAESMDSVRKTGFAFTNELLLPPGKFNAARFIVRDDLTGKLGTITVPIETDFKPPQTDSSKPAASR